MAFLSSSRAKTWYSSPTGSAAGTGTIDDPKDVDSGLGNTMPGDTLRLLSGTYPAFSTVRNGISGSPITIEPATGAEVVINGRMQILHNYTTFNGKYQIELFDDTFTDRSADTVQGMDGMDISGHNCKIVNLRMHDYKFGILAGASVEGLELYGNLLSLIGFDDNNGQTIYMQNTLQWKKFIHNILTDNFAYHFHLWGASGDVNYMWLEKNISINAGSIRNGLTPNYLVGGQKPNTGHKIFGNIGYGGSVNQVGYGVDNTVTGAEIYDNIFNSPIALRLITCVPDRLDGNDLFGSIDGFDSGDWLENTYGLEAVIPDQFILQPNIYTVGFASLVIFNKITSANTVTVNVSNVYVSGDNLKLHNAQNWADVLELTVSELGTIDIDMRAISHSTATPQGWTAPATTFPTFGCFVVEKA